MVKYKLDKDEIVNRLKQYPEVKAVKFECPDEVYEECGGLVAILYVTEETINVGEVDAVLGEVLDDVVNPNGMETCIGVLVDLDVHSFYTDPYEYEIREVNKCGGK